MIKKALIIPVMHGLFFISHVHAGLRISKPAMPPQKPLITIALAITVCRQQEEQTLLYDHTHTYGIYSHDSRYATRNLTDADVPQASQEYGVQTKLLKLITDGSKVNQRDWRALFQKIILQYSLLKTTTDPEAASQKTAPVMMDINLLQRDPHTQFISLDNEKFIMSIKQTVSF